MKGCTISFETLADFRDGNADSAAAAQVREHLDAGCAHCSEVIAWLDRTAGRVLEAERAKPSQRLMDRLHALYSERFRPPVRRTLLATLKFDGRMNSISAGARGGSEEAFRLNYATDTHDLEIWQEPVGAGAWYIIGQVLPRDGEEVLRPEEIALTASSGQVTSITPEMDEFHLPSVPSGVYDLSIRLSEAEIRIPTFTVGASGP